ncbi:hypothetical protein AAG906_018816 [Vitis piasezkii]
MVCVMSSINIMVYLNLKTEDFITWCLMYICLFSNECHSKRKMPSLYPHAEGHTICPQREGIDMAIASRSPTPDIAKHFLTNWASITSILVGNGLNIGALRQGLTKFSQNSASSGNTKRN